MTQHSLQQIMAFINVLKNIYIALSFLGVVTNNTLCLVHENCDFGNILLIPCCLSNNFLSHARGRYKPVNTTCKAAVIPDPKSTPNVPSHMPMCHCPSAEPFYASRGSSQLLFSFVLRHYHYGLKGRIGVTPSLPPTCRAAYGSVRHYDERQQPSSVWRQHDPSLLTYDELDSGLSGSKTLSHEFFRRDGREISKSGGCSCSLTLSKHGSKCNRDDFENSRYTDPAVAGNPSDNSNRETWKKNNPSE